MARTKQSDLKKDIAQLRRENLLSHERREAVLTRIRRSLAPCARFLRDGNRTYVHLHAQHVVLPIDPDSVRLQVMFREECDLLPSESITQEIIEALHLHAWAHGAHVHPHRLSHYDVQRGVLYLSDLDRQMLVISPMGDPVIRPNGHDGVLFVTEDRWEPIALERVLDQTRPLAHGGSELPIGALVEGIAFVDDGLSVADQQLLLLVWVLSLFFPELFPTKPILLFLGPAGGGKTTALRRIGLLTFGSQFNVTPLSSTSRDFDAAVTNERLVILDNLDARGTRWLPDRLATAATGGTIKMRALFKDNRLLEYPMTAAIGISARTPDDVRREDIADRMLPLQVGRRLRNRPESELIAQVLDRRGAFFHAITGLLRSVVSALHTRSTRYEGSFRMADFADFLSVVAEVVGRADEVPGILDRVARAQRAFSIEHDYLIELLDLWVSKDGNLGRDVRARDLVKELVNLVIDGTPLPRELRDSTALGRKLQGMTNVLHARFGMTQRPGAGGTKIYTFHRVG